MHYVPSPTGLASIAAGSPPGRHAQAQRGVPTALSDAEGDEDCEGLVPHCGRSRSSGHKSPRPIVFELFNSGNPDAKSAGMLVDAPMWSDPLLSDPIERSPVLRRGSLITSVLLGFALGDRNGDRYSL